MLKKKKTRKSAATARGRKSGQGAKVKSASTRRATQGRREESDDTRHMHARRGAGRGMERDRQGRFVSDDLSHGHARGYGAGRHEAGRYEDDRDRRSVRGRYVEEDDRFHYRDRLRRDEDEYRPARYGREEEDERYYPSSGRARDEDYGGWIRDVPGRAEPARRGYARR